jgi:hypothetical protein
VSATDRTELRDAAADVAYEIAIELGVSMDFAGKGGTVTVQGFVDHGTSDQLGVFGGTTDTHQIVFRIPRQTGFPPTSFWPNDKIIYAGFTYGIQNALADNEDINQASTWAFACSRFGISVELGV